MKRNLFLSQWRGAWQLREWRKLTNLNKKTTFLSIVTLHARDFHISYILKINCANVWGWWHSIPEPSLNIHSTWQEEVLSHCGTSPLWTSFLIPSLNYFWIISQQNDVIRFSYTTINSDSVPYNPAGNSSLGLMIL